MLPDVLVTDVVMAGMQGREVAERITALQPGIAVLFMSGYTEGLLSGQGVLDPGINLIEKPFTEAALLGKLRGVLHTAAAPPPDAPAPGAANQQRSAGRCTPWGPLSGKPMGQPQARLRTWG